MINDELNLGLYDKFKIERTDGRSAPGLKHHGCQYFVLDVTHDPFALPALKAYAAACRSTYAPLAADLDELVASVEASRALNSAVCLTCNGRGRCVDGSTCPCSEPKRERRIEVCAVQTASTATFSPMEHRCERCGWPLATSAADGCVAGNCSYRPEEGTDEWHRMKRYDDEQRHG